MPQAQPLTAVFLRSIKHPATGQVDYPDGATPGLFLRVSARKMMWAMRLRTPRNTQERHNLGEYTDEQGLAWARAQAAALRQSVQHGGADPRAQREAIRTAHEAKQEADKLTLGVLVGEWRRIKLRDRSPRYATEAERALRHAFAKLWGKPATDLDRKGVRMALAECSPGMGTPTAAYGRACFAWAVARELVATNPFSGKQDVRGTAHRDRVLTDAELAEVWRAAAGKSAPFGSIVHMLILTGQRRDEVAGMGWSEVSEDRTTWTLPGGNRTKNKLPHIVPLSALARSLLPTKRGKGLVFPGDGPADLKAKPTKPPVYVGWSGAKARLDTAIAKARAKAAAEAGTDTETMPDWRLHDLRRTLATGLQRLGVRLEVIEAVLNHTSGTRAGIVGIYQRHAWTEEKRHALDAWAAHVERLVSNGAEMSTNVVPLRGAA